MKAFLWQVFAFLVSRRPVVALLLWWAHRHPYYNLEGYMNRGWVFNAYGKDKHGNRVDPPFPKLPSVRVHHILRRDLDEHPHDHPWNARTIILSGWYIEERAGLLWFRKRGDTATLNFEEYHRIVLVPPAGVLTLFITWEYLGTWGFLVNGVKVPWKEYFRMYPARALGTIYDNEDNK